MWEITVEAIRLIARGDAEVLEIAALSLRVTAASVLASCAIGMPLGAAVGAFAFPGRRAATAALSALMGLPPVVVGLAVYLLLSASGPLHWLDILYSPAAMVLAQTLLVTPLVAALTREVVAGRAAEYRDLFASLRAGPLLRLRALLLDARGALATVALAGFGRAIAEVGAVIVVGGNIAHHTRVMTTAIALETSKGELELALALGLILLGISLGVNAAVMLLRGPSGALAA
ncbi:tungstate transport system permease protein [Hasllibacter halocynthiae]|uniref:Tungstate transport system permease protein n=1 Tax=Hasllibacter halocynthiae TaxID=595589 RepID=A0A2T0X2T7_9RHOB|nr:ABC transporter permease [Hasllibacter halocynthiae]PRY93266.1 tungstate transport system permease protein [Hasllibacter halocynthiae]